MMRAYALAFLFLSPVALAQAPVSAPGSRNPAAVTGGTYKVDPGHTPVIWALDHFGFSPYSGLFGEVTGT
jgi:polyisoprenoid-binding protein YceI